MAYITITGDSDGDLHTAAMHNSKFGAIASVINGNIGPDNLTNPNSELVIVCSASHITTALVGATHADIKATCGYATLASGTGTVAAASELVSSSTSVFNVVNNSVVKIPATMVIKENVQIVIDVLTGGDFATGKDLNFQLQKSNSSNNLTAWSNVGNSVSHDCHDASSYSKTIITLTGTTGQQITAEHYIRLVVQNNDTNAAFPPTLVATIRLSAPHIT
jgi:hypothetical protein